MKLPGLAIGQDADGLPWRETRVEGVSWLPLVAFSSRAGGESRDGARPGEEPGRARRPGGVALVRMAPGAGYTAHRHVGPEVVLVLRGGYRDQWGEHRTGDVVDYPAGSAHSPVALGDPNRPVGEENPACVLYTVVPDGIELLREDPGD